MASPPWDRLDPELVRRALAGHANVPVTPASRHAAVSVLLVPSQGGVDVLLIRRAARADDPWSSHMALPGGFRSQQDDDLYGTAVRETREEVGIRLAEETQFLGCLPDVSPARGDVIVRPFVFTRASAPAIVTSQEVSAVAWADVGAIARNEFPATFELEIAGTRRRFSGFRVLDHVVWGMTYRILMDLVGATARVAGTPGEAQR
jgi:8-oxo-dGTP pyrophosphatase MutT (NUDIX family)